MQSGRFIKESSVPGGAGVKITLADGTKKMCIVAYDPLPDAEVQVVKRPRAQYVDVFYRDNLLTVVRFTVHREFGSLGEAHAFIHRHAAEVNGRGEFQSSEGTS